MPFYSKIFSLQMYSFFTMECYKKNKKKFPLCNSVVLCILCVEKKITSILTKNFVLLQ